jgi:hypothetical protein
VPKNLYKVNGGGQDTKGIYAGSSLTRGSSRSSGDSRGHLQVNSREGLDPNTPSQIAGQMLMMPDHNSSPFPDAHQ